jgi:hypothetical protein
MCDRRVADMAAHELLVASTGDFAYWLSSFSDRQSTVWAVGIAARAIAGLSTLNTIEGSCSLIAERRQLTGDYSPARPLH